MEGGAVKEGRLEGKEAGCFGFLGKGTSAALLCIL